jgi:hypothetical protein
VLAIAKQGSAPEFAGFQALQAMLRQWPASSGDQTDRLAVKKFRAGKMLVLEEIFSQRIRTLQSVPLQV